MHVLFELLGTIAVNNSDANKSIDDTNKKVGSFGESLDKGITKVGKWALAIGTACAGAATAIGKFAVDTTTEMESAFNSFSASTGLAGEKLEKYKDVMAEIYNNGYGESFDDIADAMAKIAQSSGDISPEEMKVLTEKAMLLRDTFDMEVNETLRAANMLIDQFGITGDEAYNLIAQGAQNGLNKNEDLLDTINEYAVHYKQLGYTANDFFNSLANGTDAGTFSVDKLGDAMKEFGIRVKDTSTTTTDAFKALGYDVDKSKGKVADLQKRFAEGGDTARQATDEVLESLYNMEDKVAQNAIGVGLFGTVA